MFVYVFHSKHEPTYKISFLNCLNSCPPSWKSSTGCRYLMVCSVEGKPNTLLRDSSSCCGDNGMLFPSSRGTLHNPWGSLHPLSTASPDTWIFTLSQSTTWTPWLPGMKMVQYPASESLPTLAGQLCCKPGIMSHCLAFGLSVLLGSSALNEVFNVWPFGVLTFCFMVGLWTYVAPVMILLVAPESSLALCPNFCRRTLLGSLTNFLNCNSLLSLSLNAGGWYVSSCLDHCFVCEICWRF